MFSGYRRYHRVMDNPLPAAGSRILRWLPAPGQRLLWLLAAIAIGLGWVHPLPWQRYPGLIDWATLQALAGLMVLTKGIECSGLLQRLAAKLLGHLRDQRALALALVAISALLAAVLTNDVSLFLLVPLTVSLAQLAHLPLERLVVFEALAVNTGSAATPIGNPQNLFLWQSSGVGFTQFVAMMAAPVAVMFALLVATTIIAFPRRAVSLRENIPPANREPRLLAVAATLFVIFVTLLELKWGSLGLLLVVVVFAASFPRILLKTDWGLLFIIGLMFIDLRQFATLPAVNRWLERLPIDHGLGTYLAGVLTSQVISNVPATILLRGHVHDLSALAAGVNVGGYGVMIGSLASLIALRLVGGMRVIGVFHLIAVPFLFAATLAVAPLAH